MTQSVYRSWLQRSVAMPALMASLLLPGAARADEQTVKLIQLLIDKGIVTKGQATDLLRESGPGKRAHRAAVQTADTEAPASPPPGEVRVTYVPSFVRRQIADQVRADVMSQAREEGWAEPDALPGWTKRVKIYGDMRLRYESDLFDSTNNPNFINFPSINQGSGFDVAGLAAGTGNNPPFYNTTQDRNRFRARARIGVQGQIADWLSADMRLTTGDAGPISTNQTMGSSGEFNKYGIFLDRAYLTATAYRDLQFYLGRTINPFYTTDLIYHTDLGFDGVAAAYTHSFNHNWSVFGAGGAFPVLNTAFDFSTNSSTKYASRDAYLFALQGGVEWRPNDQYAAKLAVGLFDFNGLQGSVSSPCTVQAGGAYYCDSDNTRPAFGQTGNTYFAIRNLVPPTGSTATAAAPQYYGLSSRFNVLEIHPHFDILTWHPVDVALDGEFVKNLGFNRNGILNHGPSNGPVGPQNNLSCAYTDPKTNQCTTYHYVGGDTGYMLRVTVGQTKLAKLWDWNTFVAYKYIESDATLDALNDSDFHLGGTNARGFVLGGGVGVANNTWVGLRLHSAQAVSGPRSNVDVIQLDLNAAF